MLRQTLVQSVALGQLGAYRSLSASATTLVNLEVNDKSGIATLTMNRPPVNCFSLELLNDIATALDEVEANRSSGLILASVSDIDC